MNFFTTSSPLVVSSLLRVVLEERRIAQLAENLVLVALTQCMFSFWSTLLFAVSAFIGLAFYETRIEYNSPKDNVRELDPEVEASIEKINVAQSPDELQALHYDLPLDAKPEMCPINFKSFKLPGSTPNISRSSVQGLDRSVRKNLQGFCPETTDLTELNGKPMLFPCHLRHRRVAPFKDNFQHSYLYAGTPVGLHATYSPLYSIDDPPNAKRWPLGGWFNFRAQDHAIRGGAHMTLSQKLREFLVSEVGAILKATATATKH